MCIVFYLNCTIDLYVKTISTGGHTCDLPLLIGTQKKCISSHINASQMLCAAQGDDIVLFFFEHNRTQSGKKMVTRVQVITASQVQSIGCRWQALFVLPITER